MNNSINKTKISVYTFRILQWLLNKSGRFYFLVEATSPHDYKLAIKKNFDGVDKLPVWKKGIMNLLFPRNWLQLKHYRCFWNQCWQTLSCPISWLQNRHKLRFCCGRMTGWREWQKSFWLWCVIDYTTCCSYCVNTERQSFKYLDVRTTVCFAVTE
jgi:hypothetical protein